MQKEKDNIDQLRKRLQDCEDYILRIAQRMAGIALRQMQAEGLLWR